MYFLRYAFVILISIGYIKKKSQNNCTCQQMCFTQVSNVQRQQNNDNKKENDKKKDEP